MGSCNSMLKIVFQPLKIVVNYLTLALILIRNGSSKIDLLIHLTFSGIINLEIQDLSLIVELILMQKIFNTSNKHVVTLIIVMLELYFYQDIGMIKVQVVLTQRVLYLICIKKFKIFLVVIPLKIKSDIQKVTNTVML